MERKKLTRLKRRRIRNISLNTIAILIALSGITWAVLYFWKYYTHEITNDAIVDQYITPVNIRVQGYIQDVGFTEHQTVHQGDTLLVLDDREFAIHLMDAQAALIDAEASQEVLESNINTTKNNITVCESNIVEAKARQWKVEQDQKRYAALLEQESVTEQQYEQIKSELDASKARITSLQDQKRSAELQHIEATKRIGSAQALITRKKAELAMAELNLSYCVVTAPYDGTMGRRTLGQGQLVQAGQTLSYIVRDQQKWVTANYKETQIANIYVGQMVDIRVDAIKDEVFKGRVSAISEATGSKYSLIPTDNSAGNFVKIQQRIPVRIELLELTPEDNNRLRAGMMVQAEAILH